MPSDTTGEITVYLLRHGQTELNAAGRMRGRINVALDETGRTQAEALGLLFKGVPLQRIIASPLQRARQTAAPVAQAVGVPVETEDSFNDRDYGAWTGEVREKVKARFGSVDQAPGVESWSALTDRIQRIFDDVVSAPDAGTMAIVGHDATNCALLATLIPDLADDPHAIPQRTGCWNKLIRRDGQWQAAILDARPNDGHTP